MTRKPPFYTIVLVLIISTALFFLSYFKKETIKTTAPEEQPIQMHATSFHALPGWDKAHFKTSFAVFQRSCATFLHQSPDEKAGSDQIALTVKDWLPACQAAKTLNPVTEQSTKSFFEQWFTPVEFQQGKSMKGLFTGYYMPLLHGSLTKTAHYSVPIYDVPSNLVTVTLSRFGVQSDKRQLIGRIENHTLVPFYTREDINKGAIKDTAHVLVFVDNPIDRLFLGIQGSGIIELPDGKQLYMGYAGENGAQYTAIAGVLIKKGVMTKDNASMQGIKAYLETHPDEMDNILNQNKSFVFFKILNQHAALGSQGIPLTAGYSLAVDRKWVPMGAPIWLDTTRPDGKTNKAYQLRRLMVAQDTGGAIRGAVRGDVFWGAGERATRIAGNMKNHGHYWLLLPKKASANTH